MKRLACITLALVGCGTPANNNNPDMGSSQCAMNGIVPADLRDVERAGEGLVSTTYGSYPDRKPDWTRANIVLNVLKQVWGRSKSTCPGLPTAQVMMVDQAITDLTAAIPAKDQKKAAFAANQVGLACPELFDYFKPDAPIQVIRLDAVFRQVGIDPHFMSYTAAAADLASIKTDWNNAKAAVAARTPKCHRVAGTATVAGDIEQSIMNLDAAIAAKDLPTIEKEYENGAIEIDTLELLFDCPADGVTPVHGTGATCKATADCDKGLVCDTANAGGKCAPDPATAKIGTACNSTVDCGTDPRSACNTEAGDQYPGGYCFMEPCNDVDVCPPGGTCVAIGGERPGCYKICKTDDDCRKAEGYVCQLFVTAPPAGFGPSDHACAFPCTRDPDCQAPLKCDIATKKCTP